MKPITTLFIGRNAIKIRNELIPWCLDNLPKGTGAVLASGQSVDAATRQIVSNTESSVQSFLSLREDRKKNSVNPDALILVLDVNFSALSFKTQNTIISLIRQSQQNPLNCHVWITASHLSLALSHLLSSFPQIYGFSSDIQTSLKICKDCSLSNIKDETKGYIITRGSTDIKLEDFVFPGSSAASKTSISQCNCTSRDLFNFGCKCGYLKSPN